MNTKLSHNQYFHLLRTNFLILLLFCATNTNSFAQKESIRLNNPSFEDYPRPGLAPNGWTDCGFINESPPDVQPSDDKYNQFWQVSLPAQHGATYLGMVVRDNDTWESISQPLSKPMVAGTCYKITVQLCHSEKYISQSRSSGKQVNYVMPVVLRVWGGSGSCSKREMLAETSPISNVSWQEYALKLSPKQQHTTIFLEAFYKTPTLFPYNGNLLLDNVSELIPISCNDKVIAAAPPHKKKENPTAPPKTSKPTKKPPVVNAPPIAKVEPPTPKLPAPKPEVVVTAPIDKVDATTLKVGQVIRVDKIFFKADTSTIETQSASALNDIYTMLNTNPNIIVEVGGHTNGIPSHDYCDKLSTSRAKAVADYLISRGIPSDRVKYKGYGKRNPIASNKSLVGRQKNQRVEIKILSIDG